jgi:hypothetical protein
VGRDEEIGDQSRPSAALSPVAPPETTGGLRRLPVERIELDPGINQQIHLTLAYENRTYLCPDRGTGDDPAGSESLIESAIRGLGLWG